MVFKITIENHCDNFVNIDIKIQTLAIIVFYHVE